MKIVGYKRVSSLDQNSERQLDGINLDRVFEDKASGKDTKRPQLQELKRYVREGDEVVIHSMDRLARNLDDLRKTVRDFTDQGIAVRFIKEGLTFTGEDTPMANMMLSIMGAVAEFERAIIKTRQAEGIALAKKRGVYKGRKSSITEEMIKIMRERIASGEKKTQIARDLGISRETLYQYTRASIVR